MPEVKYLLTKMAAAYHVPTAVQFLFVVYCLILLWRLIFRREGNMNNGICKEVVVAYSNHKCMFI